MLPQLAVAENANESPAIPDRQGAVVSIEAMGGQKTIAHPIGEAGADDVLALKDNPPTLYEDAQLGLDTAIARGRRPVQETGEQGHGRIELRRYALEPRRRDWLDAKPDWAGLPAIGRVESSRLIGDQTTTEGR